MKVEVIKGASHSIELIHGETSVCITPDEAENLIAQLRAVVPVPSDVQEAADKYIGHPYEVDEGVEVSMRRDAYADGMLVERERLMKEACEHLPKGCETLADTVGFAEGVKLGRRLERQDLMKGAVECNVIWYDGRLLDFTQEQLDAALDKIGAGVDAKVSVIIIKKEK